MSDNERKYNPMESNPDEVIWHALLGGTGNAIEAQEKRGQMKLIHNDVIPIECPREHLETLGFKFGEIVDDLFIEASLPQGWAKKASNHAMHSHIYDDKNRARCAIFYKAAFYDRKARLSLNLAINFGTEPIDGWNDKDSDTKPMIGRIKLIGKVIWQGEPIERDDNTYKNENICNGVMRQWLSEHYPDWQNPLAYWD